MNRRILGVALMAVCGVAALARAETLVLQQGLNGYTGCTDKELREQNANYTAKVAVSSDVMLVITG